ncbi:MAG TPA: DUF1223 domain-containing protein [Polyangiaceae bacterium]|nr:DUF1223 domain-containing protein [Polyangiaceae bacterium]
MSPRATAAAVVTMLSVAAGAIAMQLGRPHEPLAARLGTTPVVVELFTSQGCSSCPPAEEILSSLADDPSLRGKVIPLAFHVDYWDHLGWRDPFSSRLWTLRQMSYVRQMRLNSAYTPQAVISGRTELVGSRDAALESAIVTASQAKPLGAVSLTAKRLGASIVADVEAKGGASSDVMLAVVEYGVTTKVQAGENDGRTLVNDAIVRTLQQVKPGRIEIHTDPAWQHLSVVAFLQDRDSLAITNAAIAPL